jgi:hypothetical protein
MAKEYKDGEKYYLPVTVFTTNARSNYPIGVQYVFTGNGSKGAMYLSDDPDLLLTAEEVAREIISNQRASRGIAANEEYVYTSEELNVGTEVAIPTRVSTGRYRIWDIYKVTRITPKRTKAFLDDGREIRLGKYSSGLRRPEKWMEEESRLAKMDRETVNSLLELRSVNLYGFISCIPEEDMPKLHKFAVRLCARAKEYMKNRKW